MKKSIMMDITGKDLSEKLGKFRLAEIQNMYVLADTLSQNDFSEVMYFLDRTRSVKVSIILLSLHGDKKNYQHMKALLQEDMKNFFMFHDEIVEQQSKDTKETTEH
jgi:hypothetical protein